MNKATGRDLPLIEFEPRLPVPEVLESDSAYAWKQFRDAWFELNAKLLHEQVTTL